MLFLHQNRLTVDRLVGVFEKKGEGRSRLACSVRWVSFWGNKDVALARHYVATSTSALAFDKHLLTPE